MTKLILPVNNKPVQIDIERCTKSLEELQSKDIIDIQKKDTMDIIELTDEQLNSLNDNIIIMKSSMLLENLHILNKKIDLEIHPEVQYGEGDDNEYNFFNSEVVNIVTLNVDMTALNEEDKEIMSIIDENKKLNISKLYNICRLIEPDQKIANLNVMLRDNNIIIRKTLRDIERYTF